MGNNMNEAVKLVKQDSNTASVKNVAELKHALALAEQEITKQWNLLHGGLHEMPEGQEPKKAFISLKIEWRNVKKEDEDSLTVHAEGKHGLETKAVTGKGGYKQGKMFFGYGDSLAEASKPEPDEE